MSIFIQKETIRRKRLLELLFILVVFIVVVLPIAGYYGQIITWRALYPAVQAASEHDSTFRLPLACASGSSQDPVVRQNLQAALEIYEHYAMQPASLMNLAGQAYCWLGENEKAQIILEEALQKPGENHLIGLQLIALYHKSGHSSAWQALLDRRLVSVNDLMESGDSFFYQENYSAALDWYRFALFSEPSLKLAWERWQSIGLKYENKKDWQQASAVYQAALEYQEQLGLAPFRASFLFRLGVNLERLGDSANKDAAGHYYDQAIADGYFLDETDLAIVYQFRGDWRRDYRSAFSAQDYLSDYRNALVLDPESSIALLRIGQVYLEEYQDPKTAREYFEQVIQMDPELASGHYFLGQACFISGDYACAKQAYQSAVKLNPGWKAAEDRLKETLKRLENLP